MSINHGSDSAVPVLKHTSPSGIKVYPMSRVISMEYDP